MPGTAGPAADDSIHDKYELCTKALYNGARKLSELDDVIGLGLAPKQRGDVLLRDEPAVVVYVREKKHLSELADDQLIPATIDDAPTDVVVPGHRPGQARTGQDFTNVNWAKVHAGNPDREVNLEPQADFDVDDVAVLQIDDTFVTNGTIDWAKATKRFLAGHADVFDFVTFYIDTATGLPGQGSFHSGIYNTTTGINYYGGSTLNQRSAFGSTKLLAFQSIGWIGNQVLLQETGHMWGAYVRNRDSRSGPNRYDLLISNSGQGIYHWGRYFDNDHSPMDYDGIDWQPLGGNQFAAHGIADDRYHFCPLDLYLMGLVPPGEVGPFSVIQNPSASTGTITGTAKKIGVDNVIWAEGPRNPAWPNTQKVFKQAFIVLTKDTRASKNFIGQVAEQRRAFTWQFFKATRFLGQVDTTLRPYVLLPRIQQVAVSVDDDRAVVGWESFPATAGRVNYALTPAAFRRDQAHTDPFLTVSDTQVSSSHGLQLTGLTPDTTYHLEIVAETAEGLVARGESVLYTRKTADTCAPDISNVSVAFVKGKTDAVVARWHTDEPADARVRYGTGTGPTLQRYDGLPATSHGISLTGLAPGSYVVSVESRDAAGNLTVEDNGGSYYRVTVPAPAATNLTAIDPAELARRTAEINDAAERGDVERAIHATGQLVLDVGAAELAGIAGRDGLSGTPLEVAETALTALGERLGATVNVVERGEGYVDLEATPDPLRALCLRLPADTVAQEAAFPVLPGVVAAVDPRLALIPHPDGGPGRYRLSEVSGSR
ncbi:hypothetical protein ACWEVP_44895 [Amycolatopsis sp. NPDC003865]